MALLSTTDVYGNLTVTEVAKAASFSGSGSGLTSLNAANISSGTLPVARGGTGATSLSSITVGTASKLGTTNVGSSTTPIYLKAGVPTACSSVAASVTVSNSTSTIYVLGTTTTGSVSTINRASGVYISSGTTVNASGGFYVQSARKYKKDIVKTDVDAVKMINDVEVVNFHYKDDENQYPRIGFIADVTDPLLSTPNQDKMDTTNCIGVLLKAIQQLDSRLRKLEG